MKRIAAAFILISLISCKKENNKWITGTVVQQGCQPGSWLVRLDNADASKHSFLCDPLYASASSSTTHCGNTVAILNLPSALA
jgi:hypothetical protein